MPAWLFAILLALPGVGAAAAPARDEGGAPAVDELPPAVREAFARRVLAGHPSRSDRLQRMLDFVFDPQALGMRYDDTITPTVAEAIAARRANCLGFTLLFVALGREAGLDVRPQAYAQTLSWQRERDLFFRSSHVNAEVRSGPRTYTLDVARDVVITRGEPQPLRSANLLAHYHNNRAIELQAAGDPAAAQQQIARALTLDATQPGHWSNAGVLALRRGDVEAARAAYATALRLDPAHADALFNALALARREGDAARERELRARLEKVQRRDPFHHFLQALAQERAGDLAPAIASYRRAIELQGSDARLHAALAGALQRTGDVAGARAAWRRAVARSAGTLRIAYEARLRALPASSLAPKR